MLTIFTIPKLAEFGSTMYDIQARSRVSWKWIHPLIEVLSYGPESPLPVTFYGSPRLNDTFTHAAKVAKHDVLMYSNADMLYDDQLRTVYHKVYKMSEFLVVGQRTDVTGFTWGGVSPETWAGVLREIASKQGKLHSPAGIDYFIFPKTLVKKLEMPPFTVGRPAWDNWMIARCLELGVPVIDATNVLLAVHQNHSFAHLPGGFKESRQGPEAQENRQLAGDKLKTILDATCKLENLP